MKKLHPTSRILLLISALAMISAYFTPLWQIKLWAPQYPEGLGMQIWIDHLSGQLDNINGVNHYIGMKVISDEMFPEFLFLKYVFAGIISIGLVAAIINRKWGLYLFFTLIVLLGIGVLVDMYLWGYDYGHDLNPKAAIKIPDMTYQPPLIGYKQLLNFLAYSGPALGGWILTGIAMINTALVAFEWKFRKK